MGKTHTLFKDNAADGNSDIVHPQRRSDEAGIFQIEWDGAGTFDIQLQGRSVEDSAWYYIEAFDETSTMTGTPKTTATVVAIFPQMRARVVNLSGAVVSIWLTE
jgi:flagellar hook assembly protein FlgD